MPVKLQPQIVEVDFQRDKDRHTRILEAVRQRRRMSYDKMSQRHTKWAEMEERFQAYVKPTENDSARSNLRKTGRPQFTTIEIPYSYAILLTAHTYQTSVFLGRNPVFQYEGRHDESQESVQAVEAIMDYQLNVGEMLIPLYIWLMDAPKYGLGVVGHNWVKESVVTTETSEEPITYFGIDTGRTRKKRSTIRIPGYHGNKLFNVKPQDWFPDPRVSIARFQEGEFCGRRAEVGWNTILKRQQDGLYYNVDQLKTSASTAFAGMSDRGSSKLVLPEGMETMYLGNTSTSTASKEKDKWGNAKGPRSFVELFELEVEIVPKSWELGTSETPEKYVITVANDEYVVSIEPLGLYHDKFTFDVLEDEIEGYALSKRSLLEVLDPLNHTMSWLFNTHMHNVRKSINDQLVVDPSGVVMKDLTDPNAGRLIRLKPEAYGKDARAFVHQLTVQDITSNHMKDALLVGDMMQRVSGVVENVMGMQNRGGRQTATEVRTNSGFSMNRLKTKAEYSSAMGFAPLSAKMLSTTQQRYDQEKMFRIAGDLLRMRAPMKVLPEDIAGKYDYIPVDGSMPVDRYAQSMLWKEIMGAAEKSPSLVGRVDVMGILKHIAYLSGVKNFSQFEIKVIPDGQVPGQVAAGNIVPLGTPSGSGKTTGTRSAGAAPGAPGTEGQIPQPPGQSSVGRAA